jgi:peptidoglycan/LPS O-acetylase OafA/YrhL
MLSDILDASRNSFNLVRLMAAISVIVSHAYVMRVGPGGPEPLAPLTPFTLGQHAVNAFFFLSGLTLSLSLARNPSLLHFTTARFLRVIPGLFVCGAFFAFVLGPVMTNWKLTDYFGDAHTWLYPLTVMVKFARAEPPHGVFTTAPFSEIPNDPLWTLKYELAAYAGLALLQLCGLLRSWMALIAMLLIAGSVYILTGSVAGNMTGSAWPFHMGRYGFCFLLGALAYRFRDFIPLMPWLLMASLAVAVAATGTRFAGLAYIVFVSHAVIVVGSFSFGPLTRVTRDTDISYGTYIYGWPIQQSIVVLFPAMSAEAMIAVALTIVLPLAFASWKLVEKPALDLKRSLKLVRLKRESA